MSLYSLCMLKDGAARYFEDLIETDYLVKSYGQNGHSITDAYLHYSSTSSTRLRLDNTFTKQLTVIPKV